MPPDVSNSVPREFWVRIFADAILPGNNLTLFFMTGDDPPRDRTSELRSLGFPSRRLGPVQMTTDTALGVSRRRNSRSSLLKTSVGIFRLQRLLWLIKVRCECTNSIICRLPVCLTTAQFHWMQFHTSYACIYLLSSNILIYCAYRTTLPFDSTRKKV